MKRSHLIGVLAIAAFAALAIPFGHAAVVPDLVAIASGTSPDSLMEMVGLLAAIGMMGKIDLIKSKQLRQDRAALVEANKKTLEAIEGEKNEARVKELEAEWDKRDNDIEALGRQIERAERQERLDAEMEQPANQRRSGREAPNGGGNQTEEQRKDERERYRRAYWAQLAGSEISGEDEALLRRNFRTLRGNVINLEGRAMSTAAAAGGYGIPEGFMPDLEASMLAFGGVRPVARILRTQSGNALPWPTVNDTGNEASIVGEGSALTSPQDPPFGVVNFGAYMYRTLVLASFELLQDEGVNLQQFIMSAIAERFARGTNRHYTVGTGSSQPKGFIPASSSGVTAATATSVSYADLVDLEHSVDPAYRNGASFQMKDATIKIIKKLVDGEQRPLWSSGIAVREPNTILGYPYNYNEHMAAVQASNKSVAFGNFNKFVIRDVQDLLIVRANELHLANGQVGFYAFFRTDSQLLDAGTDPIKHLTHPSPD